MLAYIIGVNFSVDNRKDAEMKQEQEYKNIPIKLKERMKKTLTIGIVWNFFKLK